MDAVPVDALVVRRAVRADPIVGKEESTLCYTFSRFQNARDTTTPFFNFGRTAPMTDRADAEASVTRFLARRDHSTGELRKKLAKRGYDADLIEDVIADCVDAGWVDDEAFATHQARILADKGWGPFQVRSKLERHGVPRDLAEQTVDSLGEDWTANARRRLRTKYGELADDDRERAFRHLTYRGFPGAIARRAIFD